MPAGKKNVIILGATSGIGKEMALWFAERGWRVGIAGRRKNLLNEIHAQNPDYLIPQAIDIRSEKSLISGLKKLEKTLGEIDIFIISSGTGFINSDFDNALEQETISTNVVGFTTAVNWGYKYFEQRKEGTLATITSVGGLLGTAEGSAYSATKAYQIIYLNGLQKRAAKTKIKIVDIRPGSVNTSMMKGEGHFWISTPAKAADVACRAIIKGKRIQYVTPRWKFIGFVLKLLGLFN